MVRELSRKHRLTVMTRANNRPVIEAATEEWVKDVCWEWVDPPSWLVVVKRRIGVQLFYICWQIAAYRTARNLLAEGQSFDLIHHVTFGKYSIPSPLAKLGKPFVFGPVGGGDITPPGLGEGYPLRGKVEDFLRKTIHRGLGFSSYCRGLYESAAWTFAATEQTKAKLRDLGVERVSVLPQSGIGVDELEFLKGKANDGEKRQDRETLRLITACRLIHWKGVDVAIEAIAKLKEAGTPVHLTVLQDGPELARLKTLVIKLGLENDVDFTGKLPGLDDVYRSIVASDALVHPAFHEAFGQSCLESLALGVPVICLDWGGPGMIVDEASGWKVAPGSREETVDRIAGAMSVAASESAEQRSARSENARNRARGHFLWENIAAEIDSVYGRI